VAWDTLGIDGDDAAIQLQHYGAIGDTKGQRILANRTWAGRQATPTLISFTEKTETLLGDKSAFLVGWQQGEGDDTDLIYRVLPVQ
ncbi:MAG: hypothetical protein QF464_13665, partial [Myxococcota bacterium]|jgi:hypothetical protein|nr:hypothetical protein [Myxococcota bacterium]